MYALYIGDVPKAIFYNADDLNEEVLTTDEWMESPEKIYTEKLQIDNNWRGRVHSVKPELMKEQMKELVRIMSDSTYSSRFDAELLIIKIHMSPEIIASKPKFRRAILEKTDEFLSQCPNSKVFQTTKLFLNKLKSRSDYIDDDNDTNSVNTDPK